MKRFVENAGLYLRMVFHPCLLVYKVRQYDDTVMELKKTIEQQFKALERDNRNYSNT